MIPAVCFILLVSLEGLKATNENITITDMGNYSISTEDSFLNSATSATEVKTKAAATMMPSSKQTTTMCNTLCNENQRSDRSSELDGCLINLKDKREMVLWIIITLLSIICFLLLVIITCLTCKCCRGTRDNEMVVMQSSKSTRRDSRNGGPSETDILLKDCSLVKVEIETTLDESREPQEVGEANAEVENQVSTEENKNPANDTSETTPTEDIDQSCEADLKMDV